VYNFAVNTWQWGQQQNATRRMTMHIKKLSKPAYAANSGGYDLTATMTSTGSLFTGIANLVNSLVNLLQFQRVFGVSTTKS
jgi:hypothetical protein